MACRAGALPTAPVLCTAVAKPRPTARGSACLHDCLSLVQTALPEFWLLWGCAPHLAAGLEGGEEGTFRIRAPSWLLRCGPRVLESAWTAVSKGSRRQGVHSSSEKEPRTKKVVRTFWHGSRCTLCKSFSTQTVLRLAWLKHAGGQLQGHLRHAVQLEGEHPLGIICRCISRGPPKDRTWIA